MERGTEIDRALALSIFAERESDPVDVSEGMLERSWETLSDVHKILGGH